VSTYCDKHNKAILKLEDAYDALNQMTDQHAWARKWRDEVGEMLSILKSERDGAGEAP